MCIRDRPTTRLHDACPVRDQHIPPLQSFGKEPVFLGGVVGMGRSLNIPAVTMLQRYGVPKFHSFLQQIGLKTINRSSFHYGLSLILGGAEATLWDVTNAYAMMGRSLLQLPQRSCSLLLPTSRITESTDPFQPGAVWQTFDALKEVNRPEEIGRASCRERVCPYV